MTSAAVPDTLMSALSDHVAAQIGLSLPRERWPDLWRGMCELAGESDAAGSEACLRRLMASPLQREQIETLARHLSVGETYFFREPDTFDALEHEVLVPLIAARRATGLRMLNLWSAGCCTGEETYSLAILLDRLIPDGADWNITLLGTDIHPGFLARAEQGLYGDWSFRGVPADIKTRYFDDLGQGVHAVQPVLKRRVRFGYFNLAEDGDPGWRMDVVLCRNVLMYFKSEKSVQALVQLHRSLVDGGWLVLGAAETPLPAQRGFAKVSSGNALLYRKQPMTAVAPRVAPRSAPAAPRRKSAAPAVHGATMLADRARVHADEGRLAEAERCCKAAIAADKCDPRLHYLHSLILEEAMRLDEAKAALRRALYFGTRFVLGHVALGRLCQRQGERVRAVKHFAKALDLLEREPAGVVLPESDGLSAAQLSAALMARLQEA